ncbi:hypothetical protein Tco_0354775, partial [Tanacetum coccineum]
IVAKGEKSTQADPLISEPYMTDDHPYTSLNTTVEPTQGDSESGGTSEDPNSLIMVVHSDAKPIKEPPVKKIKLMIDIPIPMPVK